MALGSAGAIAKALSEVFGWAVDPAGLAKMRREHLLEVMNAAYKIARDKSDYAAIDIIFEQLRELSAKTGP